MSEKEHAKIYGIFESENGQASGLISGARPVELVVYANDRG